MQQQQGQPAAALAPAAPVYIGYVASLDVEVVSVLAAAGSSHQLQLWSAESPALYLLVVNLRSDGYVLEVEGCQVCVCVGGGVTFRVCVCVCGGGGDLAQREELDRE